MATQQRPSVGRIVHFTPRGWEDTNTKGQPYAAVITHVWSDSVVNLNVFPDGSFPLGRSNLETSVSLGDPGQGGTWCWPPYVPAEPQLSTVGTQDQVGEPSMKGEAHDTFDPETETTTAPDGAEQP
jgi:hypothetical protein